MNQMPSHIRPHFSKNAPPKELGLEDIVILTYRLKGGGTDEKRALFEWSESQPFMAMESCTRQVLLGFASTMDLTHVHALAARENSGVDVLRGRDAYNFALKLVTGLLSTDRNDTQIKGQFFSQFDAFKEKHGKTLANPLNRILNSMRSDCKQLQRGFTNNIIIPRQAQIARQLLDLPAKASLALAFAMKDRELPDAVTEIMSTFGSRSSGNVDTIFFCPTKRADKMPMERAVAEAAKRLSLKSKAAVMSDDTLGAIMVATNGFITLDPMGTPFDDRMRAIIEGEPTVIERMVHMGHNRNAVRGVSTPEWLTIKHSMPGAYYLAEEIHGQYDAAIETNKRIRAAAEARIGELIHSRYAAVAPAPR